MMLDALRLDPCAKLAHRRWLSRLVRACAVLLCSSFLLAGLAALIAVTLPSVLPSELLFFIALLFASASALAALVCGALALAIELRLRVSRALSKGRHCPPARCREGGADA